MCVIYRREKVHKVAQKKGGPVISNMIDSVILSRTAAAECVVDREKNGQRRRKTFMGNEKHNITSTMCAMHVLSSCLPSVSTLALYG